MGRIVKCAGCGMQLDKDMAKRFKNLNYHPSCYEKAKDRDELSKYICKTFGLKAPGPRNFALMKKFEEQGMTLKGMLKALRYHYEVKHGQVDKAQERIGIIPYVYEEAQAYYKEIEDKQEKINAALEKKKEEEVVKVNISNAPKKKKQLLDLDIL